MTLAPAGHVFIRNWLVYKRIWHRSIFFGFLQPFMFLSAMGIGMGTLLAGNPNAFGGLTYLEFLGVLRDVFAECARVLEPGGRIAVNVANLGRKPYRSRTPLGAGR